MTSIIGAVKALFAYITGNTTAPSDESSISARRPEESLKPYTQFRLDNDSSDTLTLPDGRKLGYAQYGCLTGKPIFVFHGIPGSRIDGAFFHDKALETNARIISIDRPGIGWSSPHPNRKLLDHVKDVEHLAEHLKLKEFAVLGISGGGPYALASAYAMPPEKLKCAVLVCGLCSPDIGMKGAQFLNWIGFPYGFRYSPWWVAHYFWETQPEGKLGLSDEERLRRLKQRVEKGKATASKKDLPIFDDEGFLTFQLRSHKEVFAQGYDGWMQDGKVICAPFEFGVEDIREDLPVHLWYGKQDVNVPANHGITTAAALGGRAYLRVEDETHASMEINYMREYLSEAVKCVSDGASLD